MPPDAVLVECRLNQGLVSYAGVGQVNEDGTGLEVYEGPRVPLVWFPDNSDVRKLRLSNRPCPVPPDPSNWHTISVIGCSTFRMCLLVVHS